jgi:DNA-binding beta-propeller fold protein YncE
MGSIRRGCRFLLPLALLAATVIVATPLPASASDPLTFVGMIGLPRLDSPEGVAVDADGNVYVADPNVTGSTANDRLLKFDANGVFLDVIAAPGSSSPPIPAGEVADPSSIAIAPSGDIYLTERYSNVNDRVSHFDELGNIVGTWGDYGTGNGEFRTPKGIAVDSLGDVYVADYGNDRIQKFTSAGNLITSWTVTNPTGIAVDGSDVVYVAGNNTVARFDPSGGALTSWAVSNAAGIAIDGSDDVWVTVGTAIKEYDNLGTNTLGTYASGSVSGAQGIAVAPSGKVYVADTSNGRVQRFSSAGVSELEWGAYPGDGVPDVPSGIAVDSSDNVYITKKATDTILKFAADGTFLGELSSHGNTDGKLDDPAALDIGPDGNLYVADTTNQRIQKLDTSGGYLAQWGSLGSGDGFVNDPSGIAVDPASGNVYVADTGNNRIEEFTAGGLFVRKWGQYGNEDGNFKSPKGLAIDGSGHVWVADSANNRIQEFSSTGTFIARFGSSGSADQNMSAPSDVGFDDEGTLWVVDKGHNRIQRFTTGGTFLARLGGLSAGLDTAQFSAPLGIAVDSTGRILVTDSINNRVQVFEDKNGPDTSIAGPPISTPSSSASLTMTANEPGATFTCKLDGGSYALCSSTKNYSGLTEGSHTFYAYATDTLGFDGNPTTYTWAVDTTPPTASITVKPSSPTGSTTANFSFTSSEGGVNFLCAKDGTNYSACTSPKSYSNLGAGDHVFHVKAIDAAGNIGSATTYSWTIDTTPPTIVIDSAPSGYVQSTNADISFHSGDPSATFECKLDGGSYASCGSPMGYSGLIAGQHSFYVKATDDLGNVSSPAHITWTVDTQTHRPDNQIATGTTYVGNDVYNSDGSNQTKTLKAKVGKTVTFKIRIENDGSGTDPLTVTGAGSAKGYSVTYFSGTTNITSKVVAGTYRLTLDVGQSIVLKMTVKVGSNAVASRSILVKTSADHQPSRLDAVKAVVKRA